MVSYQGVEGVAMALGLLMVPAYPRLPVRGGLPQVVPHGRLGELPGATVRVVGLTSTAFYEPVYLVGCVLYLPLCAHVLYLPCNLVIRCPACLCASGTDS